VREPDTAQKVPKAWSVYNCLRGLTLFNGRAPPKRSGARRGACCAFEPGNPIFPKHAHRGKRKPCSCSKAPTLEANRRSESARRRTPRPCSAGSEQHELAHLGPASRAVRRQSAEQRHRTFASPWLALGEQGLLRANLKACSAKAPRLQSEHARIAKTAPYLLPGWPPKRNFLRYF